MKIISVADKQVLAEKTGIREKVIEEIQEIAAGYDIDKVVLFGSRARGDYRDRSDIDLAVYGKDYAKFSLDADDMTTTLLKYDFVDMYHSVQPPLKKAIDDEGILLYEKI